MVGSLREVFYTYIMHSGPFEGSFTRNDGILMVGSFFLFTLKYIYLEISGGANAPPVGAHDCDPVIVVVFADLVNSIMSSHNFKNFNEICGNVHSATFFW